MPPDLDRSRRRRARRRPGRHRRRELVAGWVTAGLLAVLGVAACSPSSPATGTPMAASTSPSPASPSSTISSRADPPAAPDTAAISDRTTVVSPPSISSTAATASTSAASGASSTPTPTSLAATTAPAGALPSVGLSGVNDPTCRSDARPVVLLHGTFSTVASNFSALVPALQAAGRCVYGLDYGSRGVRPVTESAAAVSTFIDDVLAVTGADQVDVVGYSQGGLVLRTALRQDGMASRVATAVLLAPSFHGTTSPLIGALPAGACPACADQAAGSPLLTELAAGGDLDGEVRYAVLSSRDDVIVTPVASQVPVGPADRVTSLLIQDRCPAEQLDHMALPADPGVIAWTVAALSSGGDPDPATLTCD